MINNSDLSSVDLSVYFRSVLDIDRAPIVLCDLNHTIIYMNKVAIERYHKRGGSALIGKSLLDCHNPKSNDLINKAVDWFREDKDHNYVYTFLNEKENKDVYMVALRDSSGELIGYYEKHEYRSHETMALYCFE